MSDIPQVIKAASKFHQSKDVLKLMTEKALGRTISDFYEKELAGGMCYAVYSVQADGEKYVIKIAPHPESKVLMRHEKDNLLNEAISLGLLEEKLDIPAPKLLLLDTSRTICQSDYFVMTFIEGVSLFTMKPRPTEEEINQIKKEIGIICRKISTIKSDYFGIPVLPSTHFNNNYDFILSLFKMLLLDANDTGIQLPNISHMELLELLEKHRIAINDVAESCYVHTDTWDGNLMIKDNKLEGLIDYAAIFCGDELFHHDFHDFNELNEGFAIGYGKPHFTYNENIRICVYKIWLCLGMIVECGFRNYEDPNMYSWVKGEFMREVNKLKLL